MRDHVELAVGDQRDASYVAEVTRGVEAVFWAHPDDFSLPDRDADAERTGEGLAAARRKNRIARVVLLSSIGAEKRRGVGFVDGLARIEHPIRGQLRCVAGAAMRHAAVRTQGCAPCPGLLTHHARSKSPSLPADLQNSMAMNQHC